MSSRENITIIDDLPPEDGAMLQALYSRSPDSVHKHLQRVRSKGSGSFMSQYYVGYNHKSIADCGTTSIFVENISLLAAKAIQDNPMYSGQESSTRYIDFSKQPMVDPVGTEQSRDILFEWMYFYNKAQVPVVEHVRQQHPRKDGESEKMYERAVHARAFDILRAFLPAGVTTNVAWHTNLRQARDRLEHLAVHPDPEIAGMGQRIAEALSHRYPHSGFAQVADGSEASTYRKMCAARFAYAQTPWVYGNRNHVALAVQSRGGVASHYSEVFATRPKGVELPRAVAWVGRVQSTYLLDFGSFRDLQRHRNGNMVMPLLSMAHGFEDWYLEQMPPHVAEVARQLIRAQETRINGLACSSTVRQYYCPLGALVMCQVDQDIPAFVYRVELRSSKTVHPTLRRRVLREAELFREQLPIIKMYIDEDPDDWDVRRGRQTIEER
jgi:thymidylate synthase ThyX